MNLSEIKKEMQTSAYSFLKTNEHLGQNIILLGLGGSHAYGLNTKDSDLDIRGVALNNKYDILLKKDFEQVIDNNTDTIIYSFEKMVNLLLNMNPNICEILGLKPEHYLYISPIGKELLGNKELFVSKRCINSFTGFANQQMYRLKQMTVGIQDQSELEQHILNTMQNMTNSFGERYTAFPLDSINLYIDQSAHDNYDTEIFMDLHLTHYPLRDWRGMWSEMNTTVKSYNKLGKRNKYAIEHGRINKHMYNCIRLPIMCKDILEGKGIVTFREAEHDLLMDIKNGGWVNENGMPLKKFFDLYDKIINELNNAAKHSNIPDEPDYDKIKNFVISVNERIIKNEI